MGPPLQGMYPLIRPSVCTGAPSPLGEGFWAAQIGKNSAFCGTFEYIYWELGRSAPVGRRAARVCRPYGGDVASPVGASGRPRPTKGVGLGPAPAAEFGQKTAGAQCAPLKEREREPAPSSAPFGGTFPYPLCPFGTSPLDKGSRPPGGRLGKNKKGQVWDLSLKTQRRNAVSHKISLLTFFFKESKRPRFTTGASYLCVL